MYRSNKVNQLLRKCFTIQFFFSRIDSIIVSHDSFDLLKNEMNTTHSITNKVDISLI